MSRHLPAALGGELDDRRDLFGWNAQDAPVVGIAVAVNAGVLAIGAAQVRRTEQDAPVQENLERSDAQAVVAEAGNRTDIANVGERVGERLLGVDGARDVAADGKLAVSPQGLVGAQAVGVLAAVDDAGEADPVVCLLHCAQRSDAVGVGVPCDCRQPCNQLARADNQAGGFAVPVANDLSVFGGRAFAPRRPPPAAPRN